MFVKNSLALSLLLASVSGGAIASSPISTLVISDGTSTATVDMSGLLTAGTNNNFSMVQGSSTNAFYQAGTFGNPGTFFSSQPVNGDYWQWVTGTAGGTSSWVFQSSNSAAANSVVQFEAATVNGDPVLNYEFVVVNSGSKQKTFTFSTEDVVDPTVGATPYTTYADLTLNLTNTGSGTSAISPATGSAGIQQFNLSVDGGATYSSAGVTVGQALSANTPTLGTSFFNASTSNSPVLSAWNYMQLVSKFTLTANTTAELIGNATINPVPEPLEGAMLLLGLALLIPVLRRSNQS